MVNKSTARRWLQIRGDPSVRQFVFDQARVANEFDHALDAVLARVQTLVCEHGVFHAKIHFSSGQVSLWLLSDPLRYRVHVKEEFLDPQICLAYARAPYSPEAMVSPATATRVFAEFKRLRTQDSQIYLRAGSLNVMNGMVGLNFSCDGSHYLDHADFLRHAESFGV